MFRKLFNADEIVLSLFKALATRLPILLVEKLADGKITREELFGLIREISDIVAGVLVASYNRSHPDEEDVPTPLEVQEL